MALLQLPVPLVLRGHVPLQLLQLPLAVLSLLPGLLEGGLQVGHLPHAHRAGPLPPRGAGGPVPLKEIPLALVAEVAALGRHAVREVHRGGGRVELQGARQAPPAEDLPARPAVVPAPEQAEPPVALGALGHLAVGRPVLPRHPPPHLGGPGRGSAPFCPPPPPSARLGGRGLRRPWSRQ